MASILSIGVRFQALGNLVSHLNTAGGAAARLNIALARQQGIINSNTAALARYGLRMDEIAMKHAKMQIKVGLGAAAIGAGFLGDSIKQAADLQSVMTQLQMTGRYDNNQQAALQKQIADLSTHTSMSQTQIAQIATTAAHNGLSDYGQLTSALAPFAKYADVLYRSPQHIDPSQTVESLSSLSHLMGVYKGPALDSMLDQLFKMQLNTNKPLSQIVTQAGYFAGDARALGMTTPEILEQITAMNLTGQLQNKGGTGIDAVFRTLIKPSKTNMKGLESLGIFGSDGKLKSEFKTASGGLAFDKMQDYLAQMVKGSKDQVGMTAKIVAAFGVQGGRFENKVLNPQTREQIAIVEAQEKRQKGVTDSFKAMSETFNFQLGLVATDFQDIMIAIGNAALPEATKLLTALGNALQVIVIDLNNHPEHAMLAVKGILAGIAASIGFAMAGLGKLVISMRSFAANLAAIAAEVDTSVAATRVGAVGGATGAAVTGAEAGGATGLLARFGLAGIVEAAGDLLAGIGTAIAGAFSSIPIAIAALVGLGAGFLWLIANLPDIAANVDIWWRKNQASVVYTIGYGVGSILRVVGGAFGWLFQTIGGMISTFWNFLKDHWLQILNPATEAQTIAQAVANAEHFNKYQPQNLKHDWGAGFSAGWNGKAFAPPPQARDLTVQAANGVNLLTRGGVTLPAPARPTQAPYKPPSNQTHIAIDYDGSVHTSGLTKAEVEAITDRNRKELYNMLYSALKVNPTQVQQRQGTSSNHPTTSSSFGSPHGGGTGNTTYK